MVEGETFLSLAAIPLLLSAVFLYYAFRLLALHDTDCIRQKNDAKKLKDKDRYTQRAGELLLFLALGSLVMLGVCLISMAAALALLVIWFVIFGLLWAQMDRKYGAK